MERAALLSFVLTTVVTLALCCFHDCVHGQDQQFPQLDLDELEGDLNIIMALDTALGSKTTDDALRSRYLKQLVTNARARKQWYSKTLKSIRADERDPDDLVQMRKHYSKQFRIELYRTLLKTRFLPAEEYRKLDERDARLVRLTCLMRHHGISTIERLKVVLKIYGSTLEQQQDAYIEQEFGKARPW